MKLKVNSLEASNAAEKFNIKCFSVTCPDSEFYSGDKTFCLDGYKLTRTNHPKNIMKQ